MDPEKQKLLEQFKKLPRDIQTLSLSEELEVKIQLIGKEVSITPIQSLDLEDEIMDVLTGVSHPKDFIKNIQTKIGVDEQKAWVIAERVNDEIFQPVKESLKIVHNIKDEGASQASLASIPTPLKPPVAPTTPSSFPQMIIPPKINLEIPPKPPVPPQPPQSQNIFEQKLQGVFKMPKEETLVPPKTSSHEDVRAIPPSAGFSQKPSSSPVPPTPPRAGGVDPYREQPK